MQIVNDYDKEVYNGDIGRIVSVDPDKAELVIRFDERDVPYRFDELDQVALAYATTIHKSQGSEYPVVVIPVTLQHLVMLHRNLLYTGVTRGKRLVILVGEKKGLRGGGLRHHDQAALHQASRMGRNLPEAAVTRTWAIPQRWR